ncbi:MAG: hypothetical protein IRY92_04590 [Dactylosporangium sp.]|nr:hypothetical protein [Dactylosporangium sp.]
MTRIRHTWRRIDRTLRRLMQDRRGRWALGIVMLGLNVALGASVPILLPLRWVEDA